MNIKPTRNRVLLAMLSPEEHSGLIHIPQVLQKRQARGQVIAIGAGVTEVALGNNVAIQEHAGTIITVHGSGELRIVEAKELLGILE